MIDGWRGWPRARVAPCEGGPVRGWPRACGYGLFWVRPMCNVTGSSHNIYLCFSAAFIFTLSTPIIPLFLPSSAKKMGSVLRQRNVPSAPHRRQRLGNDEEKLHPSLHPLSLHPVTSTTPWKAWLEFLELRQIGMFICLPHHPLLC